MRYTLITFLSLVLLSCSAPKGDLPRGNREDCEKFQKAGDQIFKDVLTGPDNVVNSLVIIDEDKVVYEHHDFGYSSDRLQVMWSVSKTFTATAVGFAEQDGLLKTSDKVIDYFDSTELPAEPHPYLAELTLHDLLIMSAGWPDLASLAIQDKLEDWTKTILATDFNFMPGDKFEYNSINGYILSVIVSKVTGKKMVEYLDEKLFTPLGIEEFHWLESPQGHNTGGWGLYLSTEDLAKFGLFILHQGEWNGKQIAGEVAWYLSDNAPAAFAVEYQLGNNVQWDVSPIDGSSDKAKMFLYLGEEYVQQNGNVPDITGYTAAARVPQDSNVAIVK